MRVLHLFDFFSPHGGGTVDLVSKITRSLAERGHGVSLYTSDYKLDRRYLASLTGVEVRLFHCISSAAQFYVAPGLVGALRGNLRSFDIAHLHCSRSFQNIVLRHYAVKYGIPYVLDSHGSLPRKTAGETGAKWVLRWKYDLLFGKRLLRDAARVIAETNVGVREYQQSGVSQEKIVLIPPPFDTGAFAELPPPGIFRERYALAGKKIVMFLGRIHWIKGLDFLTEAFAALARERADAVLVVVGNDDGYQTALEKLIGELKIADRVLFTGFLGGESKLAALVDADVVVQTSRYEQGAWAPIEAVLCGTPIIVSSNSGAGEDVKRMDAGYLVAFGNTGELQEMMAYVLDHPAEAGEKTRRARDYVKENLSLARGIERYEELYRAVMEEGRKN